MGIGPFESFSFPGVYTQTLNEAPRASAAGGLRFPAFVGVADEVNLISNYEMIRGSSSMADNLITKENVNYTVQQLDGSNRNFTVNFFPIVDGSGNGTTTNDPMKVTVYLNGEKTPVASVNGTTGEIYLVSIPSVTDLVQVTYYFKKHDTLITAEDLSAQVYTGNVNFKVGNVPIVQGDNGGITTTDPTKVIVKVNGLPTLGSVTVSAVDGDTGSVTLAVAPSPGSTVTATYYTNDLQDTYDFLPSAQVSEMLRVGYSPGTTDFINNTDYVVDTTGQYNTINWGNSYKIVSGSHTTGTEYFDSDFFTVTNLYDNVLRRRRATGTADGTNKTFTLTYTPATGQGLGKSTDSPTLLRAYVGGLPTNAVDATIASVDASLRQITLKTAPAADSTVYVSQYQNMLPDDTWTLTDTTAGATGVGAYTVSGANMGVAMDVVWSNSDTSMNAGHATAFATENVTYPQGLVGSISSTNAAYRDTQVIPGVAVQETVKLTFIDSTSYVVSSNNNGSGTAGDNTGYLNQTYVDNKTGFRVTVLAPISFSYSAGDYIGYIVNPTFVTSSTTPTRGVPGIKFVIEETTGIGVPDTAILTTYNKSGSEPNIGDFYYVTFNETKNFNSDNQVPAQLFGLEKDALAYAGPLTITNKLGIAAHMAFLNGAAAVALLQIKKATDTEDADPSAYIKGIDYFNQPMAGGDQPSLMEPVTTSVSVLNYLKTSNTIQSGIRYANEHMSYFGFAINTSPTTAQAFARSMNNERMTGIYPDGAILTLTDALDNDVEYLVDGAFLAAAVAGRDTSPAFDVATPLTKKPVTGFTRLYRRMDAVTAAQTANSGLTLLEEQSAGINIKIALTTDISSNLTRNPSVIRVKDFIQRGTRSILQPYIGLKYLPSRNKEVEDTLGSYLKSLKNAQIIVAYTGVKAAQSTDDPEAMNVVAYYSPVLPLHWILVTYNLRTTI